MISFICADSFLSSCAIISSIVSSTSALIEAGVGERLLDQGLDRVFDFGRGALGARLEALLQQCENSSASRVSTGASWGA